MNKRLLYALPVALVAIAAAAWYFWPDTKVSVKTGTVVMCTRGEMVSDDTKNIEVSAEDVGAYGVKTKVITCERHRRLAELSDKVDAALAAGDLAAARVALEEIVKLDPGDQESSAKLASVKAGRKPSASPASGDGNASNGDKPSGDNPSGDGGEEPAGPNADLTHYVPDTLAGFVGQGIVADPFVLWRDYVPQSKGGVARLVVMAEQHGTAAEAQAAIDRDVETYYSGDATSLTVSGHKAYFGTRGDLGVLAFTDGGVRLVLEMTASSGSGKNVKTAITSAGAEILR